MITRKNRKGFTLAELMLVVAIIVLLASLAFVGVARYLRGLRLLEMDNAAKEIYFAAQNRITAELVSGNLGRLDEDKDCSSDEKDTLSADNTEVHVVRFPDASSKTDTSLWDELLPFGAIDETIRLNGYYIITYTFDAKNNLANVRDVWYTADGNTGYFRNWTGSEDALKNAKKTDLLAARIDMENGRDKNREKRLHFPNNTIDAVIGHYGGESVSLDRQKLAVKFKLINDEVLYLTGKVTDDEEHPIPGANPQVNIIVEGLTSGAIKTLPPDKNNITIADDGTFYFVLDDVTAPSAGAEDKRFSKQFDRDDTVPSKLFIPGEDIRVTVEVYSNSTLANIDRATAVDNSLFQYVNPTTDTGTTPATTSAEAGIGKVRHLQNLSSEVSGVKLGLKYENSIEHPEHKDYLGINSALQTADLDWNKFKDFSIETSGDKIGGNIRYNETNTNDSFHPINLSAANGDILLDANHEGTHLAYSAGYTNASGGVSERKISNLVVGSASNSPDHAGLFGTVNTDGASLDHNKHLLTVEHLIMENPTIIGKNTAAAVVANEKGAVVLNTVSIIDAKVTASDGHAGGAVGKATNGLDLAGVKLSGECAVTASKGNAGGLVGEFDGLGTNVHITIREAENKDGSYTHSAVGDDKTSSVKVTGSNTAGNAAGGLVGNIKKGLVTIQNSYSTALVKGNVAGGLVGTIQQCYTDNQNKSAINYSYVGGHTDLGAENKGTAKYATEAEKCNVKGQTVAGGFIGYLGAAASEQLTVNGSYTTASASGEQAGGFIGKTDANVSISNSYAVGLVVDKTTGETDSTPSGAFVGSSSGTLTGSGNRYFQLINGGKPAVVGSNHESNFVQSAESSFQTYNAFVKFGEKNDDSEFYPFDSLLGTMFGTRYFLPTAKELAGESADAAKAPATHVGDWQPVDTLVINAKTRG